MDKKRVLSLIVAIIDLAYGSTLYWKPKWYPRINFSLGDFLFVLALIIFALALIWETDDVKKIVGSDLEPPLGTYTMFSWHGRDLDPRLLKYFGWVLLLIFIPAGIWLACIVRQASQIPV